MLNIKKIEDSLGRGKKMTKAELCGKLNMARTTLDAILNGGDTKVSTLEAIAKTLDLKIGFLFDEEIIIVEKKEFNSTGEKSVQAEHVDSIDMRDQRMQTQGDQSTPKGKPSYDELEAKVSDLNDKLVAAQGRIIELMENKK